MVNVEGTGKDTRRWRLAAVGDRARRVGSRPTVVWGTYLGAWALAVTGCAPPLELTTLGDGEPAPVIDCVTRHCDPQTGACWDVPAPDGTACDDGDACTSGDACLASQCVGRAVTCDDDNACTDDTCDPEVGCVFQANTRPCDDGDACTEQDACREGVCGGQPVVCATDDVCREAACDPSQGCRIDYLEGYMAACGPLGATCPEGFRCVGGEHCLSCDGEDVYVPAGRSWMGCDGGPCDADEAPGHSVRVGAFAIQRHEVTAYAFKACVDAGACDAPLAAGAAYPTFGVPDREFDPVNAVTWFHARDYCAWLGSEDGPRAGEPWRLCTEAEWEKAARGACRNVCDDPFDDACCAAETPEYPWGHEPPSCAFTVMNDGGNGCGTGITAPVATHPADQSVYGVLDMAGNVWEWVEDCWHPNYEGAPSDGSAWEDPGLPPGDCLEGGRVVRGGAFTTPASELRMSNRKRFAPDEAYDAYGFRCCRSLDAHSAQAQGGTP